jgi:uncharacterized membrane protein YeiH
MVRAALANKGCQMTPFAFAIPPLFDYFAVFLWALSGAIVGMHKRYDIAGVFVIALLSATGGSILRDGLFLNQLPPVLTNPWYLPLIALATIVVSFFRQRISEAKLIDNVISLIDAVGVPAFAVIGMQLSLMAGVPIPGVVLIGLVNGFGGGFLRDITVGNTPAALRPGRFYVSAAFVACVLFVVLVVNLGVNKDVAAWIVIGVFFALRLLSVRYDWRTRPVLPPPPGVE